jgi:agmatinase
MPGAFHADASGSPRVMLAARGAARSSFGLVGIPHDSATTIGNPGARFGPALLREMLGDWLARRVVHSRLADVDEGVVDLSGTEILDFGDVELPFADTTATLAAVSGAVSEVLGADSIPIAIGGDHGITFPAVRALHDSVSGPIGLIQLDAHNDLDLGNPRQGEHSGSSGMRRSLELDRLDPAHLVQIGLRGYTSVEQHEIGERLGVRRITARGLEELGATEVVRRALDWLLPEVTAIYLTVDLDVLDPGSAPGTGWPEPAGIATADLFRLIRGLAPHLDAIDIAELNPLFDQSSNATAVIAARVVLDLVTARARG